AAIAVLVLARPVGAALVAPYHWATRPWTGTPGTSAFLGQYARWTGDSTDVIAALALTLAGALAAVGLGGRTDSDAESVADRIVFVLAVLAAGAGGAGSLATRSATIEWLAGSVVVGLIGAIFGRYLLARVIGWNVAGSTAQLLALAATLAVGAPARWAAFPVL